MRRGVRQESRRAAAELLRSTFAGCRGVYDADEVEQGRYDHHPFVEAFDAHWHAAAALSTPAEQEADRG
jgi:hypothetical protein